METSVCVATFLSEVEAQLAQATLAAAGIESVLRFEAAGGMLPVLERSEGIKLLVDQDRAEEARTILVTPSEDEPGSRDSG